METIVETSYRFERERAGEREHDCLTTISKLFILSHELEQEQQSRLDFQ